ncbi:fatty-acid amide hydrolase 2 isoform X2 [Cephus cinctus]|nr:fatty-acid amide hydrolase 2 isoform X2 [Cephus cinctus]
MANAVTQRVIWGLMFVLRCFIIPVTRLRKFTERKQCPPIRNKILLLSATEIATRIRKKELTSEEVVAAYIDRCKEVNPVVNAIVQTRFDDALEEARKVDFSLEANGKNKEELSRETPLLGIPVTVKESIAVRGLSHCAGTQKETPRTAKEDAEVVKRIREAGGIPILVSNTPEMCMCWESYNKVTGTTWNPYDTKRTAGGSSGGEAALLGSGASVLSLSSDIGGSARLPAMFCGVFGHKPTPGWVSTVGHMPNCDDISWTMFFSIGPMVRYAVDLPLLLNVMSDHPLAAVQLNKKVALKDMKFFYMEDDCGSGATDAVDREIKSGIRRLVKHLETAHGIKAIKAELTDMKFAFEIATTILLGIDGADSIFMKDSNPYEWKSVFVEVLRYVSLLSPHTFPNIAYGVLKRIAEKIPRAHYEKMVEKNASLKKQFEDLLGDNGVLIYPTFVSAAHYPYEIYHKVCNVSYMMIFNSLGLPVTQCPMGLNRNGLPIGLQVVANPNNDHLSITLAREIEKAFGGWREPVNNEKMV